MPPKRSDLPTGVYISGTGKRRAPYQARVRFMGQSLFLGHYATPEQAHAAYLAAQDDPELLARLLRLHMERVARPRQSVCRECRDRPAAKKGLCARCYHKAWRHSRR